MAVLHNLVNVVVLTLFAIEIGMIIIPLNTFFKFAYLNLNFFVYFCRIKSNHHKKKGENIDKSTQANLWNYLVMI